MAFSKILKIDSSKSNPKHWGSTYGPQTAGIFFDDNGDVVKVRASATDTELVGTSATQTLTNKTLTSAVLTTCTVTTSLLPTTSDGAPLGSTTKMFSDLFLASGAVVNFNNGDITLTHASNTLAIAGGKVTFDTAPEPATTDGAALGSATVMWSDLFLASGGVINFNNGDVTITHSSNDIAVAGGTLTTSGGCAMGAATTWSGTPTFTAIPSFIGATSGAVTAALLFGGGTSATKCSTSTADKNFIGFWTESTATSGDSRGLYLRHYIAGAGGAGEAARIFGTVADVAAAGTVNGAHISLSITGASGAISGQGFAARLTFGADAQTRTLNGNCAVLNLDSDIATGNTVPNGMAFIRVTDTAAVRINQFAQFPAVADATLIATHVTDAMTHSVRCALPDGTLVYLMATTTATNRGGGV